MAHNISKAIFSAIKSRLELCHEWVERHFTSRRSSSDYCIAYIDFEDGDVVEVDHSDKVEFDDIGLEIDLRELLEYLDSTSSSSLGFDGDHKEQTTSKSSSQSSQQNEEMERIREEVTQRQMTNDEDLAENEKGCTVTKIQSTSDHQSADTKSPASFHDIRSAITDCGDGARLEFCTDPPLEYVDNPYYYLTKLATLIVYLERQQRDVVDDVHEENDHRGSVSNEDKEDIGEEADQRDEEGREEEEWEEEEGEEEGKEVQEWEEDEGDEEGREEEEWEEEEGEEEGKKEQEWEEDEEDEDDEEAEEYKEEYGRDGEGDNLPKKKMIPYMFMGVRLLRYVTDSDDSDAEDLKTD